VTRRTPWSFVPGLSATQVEQLKAKDAVEVVTNGTWRRRPVLPTTPLLLDLRLRVWRT